MSNSIEDVDGGEEERDVLHRWGVSGVGRAGGPPPSQQSTLWTNQPHSPSPQVMNDRPWPIQGGAGMDMGR